jgi:DNA-binding NarL/FixJ family response regulator
MPLPGRRFHAIQSPSGRLVAQEISPIDPQTTVRARVTVLANEKPEGAPGECGLTQQTPQKLPNEASSAITQNGKKSGQKNASVRVTIVDDDEDMRVFLTDLLASTGEFVCVGSFANGADALSAIPRLQPDLVLMDLKMPQLNGIDCTRGLKEILPEVKVVVLTAMHDIDSLQGALHAGAAAFLLKPASPEQCLATIRFAIKKSHAEETGLTQRETEVMRCLAQGLLYKEIADKLGISYSAVHKYQHKIFLKLHAANRSEAIRIWHALGH